MENADIPAGINSTAEWFNTVQAECLDRTSEIMSRALEAPHTCHASGCSRPVPPRMFMCKAHWFALPLPMRKAIWLTYREGQEITKDPSAAYLHNAKMAVDWLVEHEAKKRGIDNGKR